MKTKRKLKFADIVRRWRAARKLSRPDAARKLGIPYRTLQAWELGVRTPRGLGRRLIADKFTRLTLAAILWLTLAATPAQAGDGNWWQTLNREQKLFYVGGLHDGMLSILRTADHQEIAAGVFGNAKVSQWTDGLDLFYADFRNRSIFAADAILPVAMSINGVPQPQIASGIEELRQRAAHAIKLEQK